MSWVPSEREIASVMSASAQHRYDYFVHRVCETKAVWALYDEGWASLGEDGGAQMIPFWPHQAFATAFASGAWAGFETRKIELRDFLATWLPGMRQRGIEPAIFPVATGNPVVVSVDDLDANLRHELDEVYGIEEP